MMPATAEENEEPLFIEITDQLNVDFRHRENDFIEFNREPLIPHMVSREGPALAVTDVNSDGLDDIYIGGARRQSGARSEEHTSELQSRGHLVCRLLLEK